MNHLIKARKFVPDVTISLKLFETKLFFGFCHRSHLQLHHQAFLFSSTLLRAKAHCEKTASVSHLSYHDGALILHSWEQTFIYNHKPTDTHSFAAQQCSNMRDGHLSGVFHIYSHIFNLLFDFAKWQQPHQIKPLLTAWCFCYGVVLNTAWMEERKSFYGSKRDRPWKQLIMKFKIIDVDKTPEAHFKIEKVGRIIWSVQVLSQ